jgi:lysophospholipase L1-like esterase
MAMYPPTSYPDEKGHGGVLVKEKFYDPDTLSLVATADVPQLGSSTVVGADPPNSGYDAADADIVTLTLGANDINFAGWLRKCYNFPFIDNNPAPSACNTTDNDGAIASELTNAKSDLHRVLQEIHDRGVANGKIPHVYITGYYDPFPTTYPGYYDPFSNVWVSSCVDMVFQNSLSFAGVTPDEVTWMRNNLTQLNANINNEANQFSNVTYVDVSSVMDGHRLCSSDPWVYGPSIDAPTTWGGAGGDHNAAPFHPTPSGQQAIYRAIKGALIGSSADYVTNGTFEAGNTNGWNATNTPAVTTAQAHSGTHSMTFTGSFDVTDSPNFITTQAVDIDPVDFWAKGPAGKTIRVKLRQYLTGSNNELYQSFTLTGGWDHFASKALHLYPGYSLDLNFDNPGASSGDVYYLDDIHEYGYVASETCGYQTLIGGLNADAIENCGGEAPYGTQYWAGNDTANPTLTTDTSDAHDGLYSFKLAAANAGTMAMNDSPDARDVGEVSSSATSCTATAWVKGPTGGSRSLKLRLREYSNTGASRGSGTATVTPNGSWQQLSLTYTLSSAHSDGNSHLDLNPYMTNAATGDVVRVDHITETCQ